MKIQKMNRALLLNNQHLVSAQEFEALIVEKGATELGVAELFEQFQTAVVNEDKAVMKVLKSSYTTEMEVVDGERSDLFVGIIELIRTGLRHYDAEKKAAAKRLYALVPTYQGSNNVGYEDKTGRLHSFIQDLRSEKYSADTELLDLTEWLNSLESSSKNFVELSDLRNTEKRDKNLLGKAKDMRLETDRVYRLLVDRINALALVDGDEKYADLITRWNTRIDYYRVSISLRLGAGKGGSTGTGDNESSDTSTEDSGSEDDRPEEL